jgi:hypothetical protein
MQIMTSRYRVVGMGYMDLSKSHYLVLYTKYNVRCLLSVI